MAGELVHRGPLVSLGYWNDPVQTAERFRPLPPCAGLPRVDTAVWSGDTVRMDDEGYLYFICRSDEMPSSMLPALVEFRPGLLPRNPNGKVDRRLLACELAHLFSKVGL